ncbi:hypothetical protein [Streptomyces sp. LKA04]|uniref:hypothetical protein n=1 Tax=Streptomyces sp. LKA04 TaxID=3398092 RepID=UPI003A80A77B
MNRQTLPPSQGPEYTRCGCSHIEPEHEPNAGECYSCDCAAYRPASAAPLPPADQTVRRARAALSAKLWEIAERHIVAEWICCEPVESRHHLCAKGYAALGMVKSLLVDANPEEAWNPSAPLLDAVLAVLPTTNHDTDTSAELATARATNQRLNREKQQLESELATYRRAVSQWEINDRGTYIPHSSLRAIGLASGKDILGSVRHLKHFERVEQAEAANEQLRAELRRVADETAATEKQAAVDLPTLAAALDGLDTLIATSSRDWGVYRVDAWIWAVLCGWDCEQTEHDDTCVHGALEEMAKQHGWDDATVTKARRYRAAVRALVEAHEPAAGARQDGAQPSPPA